MDDNPVGLHGSSGYPQAQSYVFREQTDGSCTIYPLVSGTRCLTEKEGGLVIFTDTRRYDQKWIIKAADGKTVPADELVTTTAVTTTAQPTTTTTAAPTTTKPVPTTTKPVPTTTKPVPTTTKPVTTAAPTKAPTPTAAVIRGDVNDDKMVSVADLVSMKNFLLGNGKLKSAANSDLNKDKRVDTYDLIILRKMLIDPEGA